MEELGLVWKGFGHSLPLSVYHGSPCALHSSDKAVQSEWATGIIQNPYRSSSQGEIRVVVVWLDSEQMSWLRQLLGLQLV